VPLHQKLHGAHRRGGLHGEAVTYRQCCGVLGCCRIFISRWKFRGVPTLQEMLTGVKKGSQLVQRVKVVGRGVLTGDQLGGDEIGDNGRDGGSRASVPGQEVAHRGEDLLTGRWQPVVGWRGSSLADWERQRQHYVGEKEWWQKEKWCQLRVLS
jgi:hypothetical protein